MEPRSAESFVLDSSVWVAFFIDGDVQHAKALCAVDEALGGRVYIPYIVLAEVATVVANKHSKAQADNFLRFVSADSRCILVDNSYAVDLPVFLDCDESISFPDASIVAFALRYGARLITFDTAMRGSFSRARGTEV